MALLSPAATTLAIDSCYLDIFLSTLCLHMLSFLHGMHFLFVPLMLYIYIGSVCEVCYIDIYAHKSTYMCIHAYVFVCLCVSVYYLGQSRHSPSKLFLLYY